MPDRETILYGRPFLIEAALIAYPYRYSARINFQFTQMYDLSRLTPMKMQIEPWLFFHTT